MPEYMKEELSRPYGFLFTNTDSLIRFLHKKENNRIITIGDVVTSTLQSNNILPFLSIIDGKTKRNIQMKILEENAIKIKNEKSTIRLSTMNLIQKILNNEDKARKIILVEGEEDLLVIPVVLFGKDKDIILYGQPNAGAVVIINNKFARIRVKQIFEKFIVKKC